MRHYRVTIEQALFFLILLVGLGLRLLNLSAAPLSEFESILSMEAYQVSLGGNPDISPGPAYSLLTGTTFYLFSDNNSTARIWSVIAGCCLLIFPYLMRGLIGRKAALIMALGIALDPSMVAFSRIAGSEILAVGFGSLALGFAYNRKRIPAGIFGGLMVLSGPAAIQGLISIGFTWLIGGLLSRLGYLDPLFKSDGHKPEQGSIWSGFLAMGVVVLVVGTLIFQFPQGLGAITDTIPAFFNGWITFDGNSASKLLVSLALYSPIALIFGTTGIIQGLRRKDSTSQWWGLWTVVSLMVVLIFPGQQTSSLIWVLLPLWGLAAMELVKYFRLEGAELFPAIAQALLIMALMALGWLNLAGLGMISGDSQTVRLRWAVIGGTIVLGAVTTFLIGLGWSTKTAQQGLAWGLLLGFGIFGFANMWEISQLRPNGEQGLLAQYPIAKNEGDLLNTLEDLSDWRTGIPNTIDIIVIDPTATLRWELRNWPAVRFLPSIPTGELPSVIINSADESSPNLSIGYRGQDFAWSADPGWNGVLPDNWPGWLVFRNAPLNISHVILWARGDLFPGGVISTSEDTAPDPQEVIPIEGLPIQ